MAVSTGPDQQVSPPQASFLSRIGSSITGFFSSIAKNWRDYLYVLPALAVMLFVIAYPIFYTVRLSFYRHGRGLNLDDRTWVGLDNYRRILSSQSFRDVTSNTFEWTVYSTLFAFIIGFAAALVVQREFVGRGLVRGVLMIPWVIGYVAAAYVWRWILHSDYGLISAILLEFGWVDEPVIFLDNVDRVMPSLIMVNVWKEFPFAMIMMLAGLQTVPEQLHRAAQIDGASVWSRFWHITLPHVKNVAVITVLLLLVTNLNSFTLVYVMTGGGPAGASEIWITEIYQIAFQRKRFDIASAYSVILFIIMMSMGYFYVKALTRGDEARRG